VVFKLQYGKIIDEIVIRYELSMLTQWVRYAEIEVLRIKKNSWMRIEPGLKLISE